MPNRIENHFFNLLQSLDDGVGGLVGIDSALERPSRRFGKVSVDGQRARIGLHIDEMQLESRCPRSLCTPLNSFTGNVGILPRKQPRDALLRVPRHGIGIMRRSIRHDDDVFVYVSPVADQPLHDGAQCGI